MAIYTVHVPRDVSDPFVRADRTAFVKDGFSVGAFLFGPLYFLRHRAWIAAAAWIVIVLAGAWLCRLVRLPPEADLALIGLVAVFTGMEASTVRRLALHTRGFDVAAVVAGGRDERERAFFTADVARDATPVPRPAARRMPRDGGVIGSFPTAEA